MYPQTHFLFSYLVGLIFVKLGFISLKAALFVGLIGLLVDVDHYIIFILKFKNMSFKDAWNKAVKGVYKGRSFMHHKIGSSIIVFALIVLFFFNRYLFWILGLGYFTHLLLDYGHFNFLKIKGKIVFKEFGLVEKIGKFELLLDVFLLIGLILILL